MFQQVKESLFTVSGLLTTVIHLFVAVGFITTYMLFQVHVLGNDPVAQMQSAPAKKR